MDHNSVVYVGVDAAKAKHAIAIAQGSRGAQVRYLGEIDTSPAAIERLAVADAQTRLERMDQQLASIVPTWSMAPVVAACQAMRGVSFLVAVILAAEIGDMRRFDNPRQLMAFLGLVPCERSTGETIRRGGLTLTGNRRVRRALVEGAWSYRHPARVTETIRCRVDALPKAVGEMAWKAQVRLCGRYRRLLAAGKAAPVAVAAIAREMAAFVWAIGRHVQPA